jgi:protein-tyrosine phosphatase
LRKPTLSKLADLKFRVDRLAGGVTAATRAVVGLDLEGAKALASKDPQQLQDFLDDSRFVHDGLKEYLGRTRHPLTHPYAQQVSSALWRGSRLDGDDPRHLSPEAFKDGLVRLGATKARSIVDLRAEQIQEPAIAEAAGAHFLSISIVDNWIPTYGQVKQFLSFVANPENQPVYVHCQAGIGRTGTMVACYRMAIQGWSAERALEEMRQFAHSPLRPAQEAFVRGFEQSLQQQAAGLSTATVNAWRKTTA